MRREPLSERARGRWRGILAQLGLERGYLTGKHGPCPMCGGKDRWRFSDKEGSGSWICNQCGRGGGTDLVMRLKGVEFKEAAQMIEGVIGSADPAPEKPKKSPEQSRAEMKALWERGLVLSPGGIVGRYLAGRGIAVKDPPASLREIVGARPMMLAKVASPDGRAVNVHRTFLAEPGVKADMAQPRLMMEGPVPMGSAVRLAPATSSLGIAEGIETALSAAAIFGIPVWAAFNADNLSAFVPPDGVERLMIFGDNDANHHGQWAAETAARAACRKGLIVEVRVPHAPGSDWNDVLMSHAKKAA